MDTKEFITLDVSAVDKLEVLQIPNVVTVKHEVERWPDKHRPVLRTLCANFPGNKNLLDKLDAVVDSLHICSDSLFDGGYEVITDVEEVKRLLTEVIIRFDTDPDFYHKEDYQLLISLLYRSLLYFYDRDDASHDDSKNTAEALQGEHNIIYFTQDKHSVVFNGKEYGFTDLSDYATEEWVKDQIPVYKEGNNITIDDDLTIHSATYTEGDHIEIKDYKISADLDGYATEDWVKEQIPIYKQGNNITIDDSLTIHSATYTGGDHIEIEDYKISADLDGYATEEWVEDKGYIEIVQVNDEPLPVFKENGKNAVNISITEPEINVVGVKEGEKILSLNNKVLSTDLSLGFDAQTNYLTLYGKTVNGVKTVVSTLDASSFVVDGMLQEGTLGWFTISTVNGKQVHTPASENTAGAHLCILLKLNTAGGSKEICIPVTSLVKVYKGTDKQIVVDQQTGVISLAKAEASASTAAAKTLKHGDSFTSVSGVTVDSYGRVTSIITQPLTLPIIQQGDQSSTSDDKKVTVGVKSTDGTVTEVIVQTNNIASEDDLNNFEIVTSAALNDLNRRIENIYDSTTQKITSEGGSIYVENDEGVANIELLWSSWEE